uniref:Uncharacterized protein n=1 Tax=Peronospora matthiolae TaxID=2874970 RepID=A0AAV1UMG6_9STRA
MTVVKPSSNIVEELLEEGMVDYEIDTVASSVYDPPPAMPLVRDIMHVAPYPFVEREEVPSPLAQLAVFDTASGVLHNTLNEDQAQYLQSVDDRRRQAHRMLTVVTASHYRLEECTRHNAGQ